MALQHPAFACDNTEYVHTKSTGSCHIGHREATLFHFQDTHVFHEQIFTISVVNPLFRRREIAKSLMEHFMHHSKTSKKLSLLNESVYCRANSVAIQNLLEKFDFDTHSQVFNRTLVILLTDNIVSRFWQVKYKVIRDRGQLVFDNIEVSDSIKLMCKNLSPSNPNTSASLNARKPSKQ